MSRTEEKPGKQTRHYAERWKSNTQAEIDKWFEQKRRKTTFAGEDIRLAVRDATGEPHRYNSWSGVVGGNIRRWLKEGAIEVWDIRKSLVKTTRAYIVRAYIKK